MYNKQKSQNVSKQSFENCLRAIFTGQMPFPMPTVLRHSTETCIIKQFYVKYTQVNKTSKINGKYHAIKWMDSLTNFNKFSIFLQDLEIPKPNSIVSNAERYDVIDEWFTTWVMIWRTKCLKQHHQYHCYTLTHTQVSLWHKVKVLRFQWW